MFWGQYRPFGGIYCFAIFAHFCAVAQMRNLHDTLSDIDVLVDNLFCGLLPLPVHVGNLLLPGLLHPGHLLLLLPLHLPGRLLAHGGAPGRLLLLPLPLPGVLLAHGATPGRLLLPGGLLPVLLLPLPGLLIPLPLPGHLLAHDGDLGCLLLPGHLLLLLLLLGLHHVRLLLLLLLPRPGSLLTHGTLGPERDLLPNLDGGLPQWFRDQIGPIWD